MFPIVKKKDLENSNEVVTHLILSDKACQSCHDLFFIPKKGHKADSYVEYIYYNNRLNSGKF